MKENQNQSLRVTTIDLSRNDMKFSSGHFTIFSATKRERLHGHNFQVSASVRAKVFENGIAFDYTVYRKNILRLCRQLNEHFLLPGNSLHLKIQEDEKNIYAIFNKERIPFLKKDVLVLPLTNITIEELAFWFLKKITLKPNILERDGIEEIIIRISSNIGQYATATWIK